MSDALFFFFQAEDGIRDGHVTGVQTCALPISTPNAAERAAEGDRDEEQGQRQHEAVEGRRGERRPQEAAGVRRSHRSEERRVGKECRGRWAEYEEKENKRNGKMEGREHGRMSE